MHVINARNVNEAYFRGMNALLSGSIEESRAGPVLVLQRPVTTVYDKPCERVLLNKNRDANPFFHLAESLWMLNGRNDTAFLDKFIKNFGARFGETNGTEHDAYGHRWRIRFGFDQIGKIIGRLIKSPLDRQCVLQMWDAHPEYGNDLRGDWKTRPCNTHTYFRGHTDGSLDMTVCCRSNDVIHGAYGANAVHFSVLLEYVATMAGLRVGKMYQVSNNFHAYVEVFEKVGVPLVCEETYPGTRPLMDDALTFDDELRHALSLVDGDKLDNPLRPDVAFYRNKFLSKTFIPMMHAHRQYKLGRWQLAHTVNNDVEAPDWAAASFQWFKRRAERRVLKGEEA